MSHPTAHAAPTAHPPVLVVLALWLHRCALSIERRAIDAMRSIAQRRRDDRGQATTEYALVLLAAALVALLVVAWATAGGGAAKISRLFNRVIDSVVDRV